MKLEYGDENIRKNNLQNMRIDEKIQKTAQNFFLLNFYREE